MSKKKTASVEALEELHFLTAKIMLERLKAGDVDAATLGQIIKFLSNNKIDAIPTEGSPLDGLRNELPFDTEASLLAEQRNLN